MRTQDSQQGGAADEALADPPPAIGTDERRMHVRAYNFWVSLLGGRAFPSIDDLDPASIGDFGPNSVLLDFTADESNPRIAWLGRALREEGELGADVRTLADVPGRSLVSRLTDHFLQIIANRAPIGFEAEFVNVRGNSALYRGILMPFSSDGETIDYIYGVINWKELADAALTADIVAAADRAMAALRAEALVPAPTPAVAPSWADGPSRSFASPSSPAVEVGDESDLADALALARESASTAASSDLRSRAALYRAICHAYAFACATEDAPEAYAELLEDAGLKAQARAPMTPIAKLVFGAACDKTRLAEYAAVLAHARRHAVQPDGMTRFLDRFSGGLKAIVAAERAARRPAAARPDPRERLRETPAAATLAFSVEPEFVLLLGRRAGPGEVAILGVTDDSGLVERALRYAARD
ncbi:PAS domain-containing protein [Sphingomonas jatrophae]|uniref:Uncharacterized protein n=1 Tax=Sphingomonas jatrophae TaxID=1166337 RepID=A0A1I6M9H9_9SPHN|nr:hypothetical protein [Sphingomonas jatrophae]SFS12349.1 hypothetical protein SAMN05192580_3723 [Sphingomonas jatrophae]